MVKDNQISEAGSKRRRVTSHEMKTRTMRVSKGSKDIATSSFLDVAWSS
jgi:hypothetical protein